MELTKQQLWDDLRYICTPVCTSESSKMQMLLEMSVRGFYYRGSMWHILTEHDRVKLAIENITELYTLKWPTEESNV